MNSENLEKAVKARLLEVFESEPGYFLVGLEIKPTHNIKVYVDADQGATIEKLIKFNRALYKWMEENLFPNGDFSIEVSSPGLEEPLKLQRQYEKNIGRFVEVLQTNGVKTEGKLVSVGENEIVVEEEKGKGKKKETVRHSILKTEIKTTKIQVKF